VSPRQAPKYEWRVQYRRRWWQSLQCRIYQSAPPARRLIERLLRRRVDLEPLVDLFVQRRIVGEWEAVDVARLIDVDHRVGGF
jgi:hypothetical protein